VIGSRTHEFDELAIRWIVQPVCEGDVGDADSDIARNIRFHFHDVAAA